MAMTDKEFSAWVDSVVKEAVDADVADTIAYIESGDLDRDVEADFAEVEAEIAELEAQGLDKPDGSDKYEFYDEDEEEEQ